MDAPTGNKVLEMNVVPDGVEAWLSYSEYRQLQKRLGAISGDDPGAYAALAHFLIETGKLPLDMAASDEMIRINAYTLLKRGYKIEPLGRADYATLKELFLKAEPADVQDMDLHETGSHRALFEMLTRKLGLDVEAGRGPVWHRSKRLLNHHGPQFERNAAFRIVAYGGAGFERVGIVVGEYDHTWMGRVLCVRGAVNISKEQQFDNVPVENARPASVADLLASINLERDVVNKRLDEFAEEIAKL